MFGRKINAGLFALGVLAATGAPALAGNGSLLVVHGIPGRDLGAKEDPALPVDVLVDGKICLLKNFTFGDIAGPFDLPAGTYEVAVSLADPVAPCKSKAVITSKVKLREGELVAAVAKFSKVGKPVVADFPVDVRKIASGNQRFYVLHAADAPDVQFSVQSGQDLFENASVAINTGAIGQLTVANSQTFIAQISVNGTVVGEPITVAGGNQSLFLIAAVGSATEGSVNLFSKVLYSVH